MNNIDWIIDKMFWVNYIVEKKIIIEITREQFEWELKNLLRNIL